MEHRRLADLIGFDQQRMTKRRVFESDRTLTDLYCLDPGQEQLLLVHEASDKVVVVMAGRVLARVEEESAELAQYEALLVPAGSKHALKNLGPDPAVLLVFLGPRLA
jgi:mannose-6-phosphate isomerase-like protein (cupin superfamily)